MGRERGGKGGGGGEQEREKGTERVMEKRRWMGMGIRKGKGASIQQKAERCS